MNKKTILLLTAGAIAGAIGGYLYYYYVGCVSGTCAITSRPVNSTVYGAVMGALLLNLFNPGSKAKQEK